MIEKEKIPNGTVVTDQPILKKGKLGLSIKNPTSRTVKFVCQTIVGSNVGLMTLVSGSDLFSGFQSKAICFVLGCMAVVAGVFMNVTGVNPIKE